MNDRNGTRQPLLSVDSLSKTYEPLPRSMRFVLRTPVKEPVRALDSVSFELAAGEVLVVVGPNGAGKSTLFRILTGLTTPSSGTASIDGLNTTEESVAIRRRIGFAPAEERTLLLRHTARENLEFRAAMQGLPRSRMDKTIDDALGFVGLADVSERAAIAMSTGMRARLQLARALLTRPDLLILDEPTSAIDPVSARDIIDLVVTAARERGTAVLMSSHRLEEISNLQDRVLLLDRGRAAYQGDLSVLREELGEPLLEVQFPSKRSADEFERSVAAAGIDVGPGETPNGVALPAHLGLERAFELAGGRGALGIYRRSASLLDVLEKVKADS